MNPIWRRVSWITCALVIVGTTFAPALHHDRVMAATTHAPCSRLVILLAGYGTSSSDVPGTFATIVKQVLPRVGYSEPPIYFSYTYPSNYSAAATYDALPGAAVGALHRTIQHELSICPDAGIDLIGHSLGGAVAMHYASLYSLNTDEGHHLRHIITLDSPVNGSSQGALILTATLLHLSPNLFDSPTGLYLRAENESPNTSYLNKALAGRLRPRTIIRTFASLDDKIVPPPDAEIPGYAQEFPLGVQKSSCRPGGDLSLCVGHGQILSYAKVMSALLSALQLPTSQPVSRPTNGIVLASVSCNGRIAPQLSKGFVTPGVKISVGPKHRSLFHGPDVLVGYALYRNWATPHWIDVGQALPYYYFNVKKCRSPWGQTGDQAGNFYSSAGNPASDAPQPGSYYFALLWTRKGTSAPYSSLKAQLSTRSFQLPAVKELGLFSSYATGHVDPGIFDLSP